MKEIRNDREQIGTDGDTSKLSSPHVKIGLESGTGVPRKSNPHILHA